MSDRPSRKRRKPAKPSRHSPNSQNELLTSSTSCDLISPDDNPLVFENLATSGYSSDNVSKSSSTKNDDIGSQIDFDNVDCISDKRVKMSSPNDLTSRSGSPHGSLDLSIGSGTFVSHKANGNDLPSTKQTPGSKSKATFVANVSANLSSPIGVIQHGSSSPIISPIPVPPSAQSAVAAAPPDRSILTQYEELKTKAMTSRARRITANARERNRVHSISSAFEQLRKSIPCYSGNQKLSKLAILKIATSYMRCLSHIATSVPDNYEPEVAGKDPKLSELVMRCTVNVLSDGKLKKPDSNSIDRLGQSDCEEEQD